MNWLLYALVFGLGLCVGSFLNMLIYRTEIDYKLRKSKGDRASNRSFCDFCGIGLPWYDNIPVLSWVILRGKTRCCHKKLPSIYPLLELFTGAVFVVITSLANTTPLLLAIILMVTSLMIFSSVFDFKWMILPDFSTFIMLGVAILVWFCTRFGEWEYVLAGLVGWGFMMVLYLVTKGKGMGMGDVKYALFMGLILGGGKTVVAFYMAFIAGAIVGVYLLAVRRSKRDGKMPFGPYLIGATMVSWFIGDKIWLYVYNWF